MEYGEAKANLAALQGRADAPVKAGCLELSNALEDAYELDEDVQRIQRQAVDIRAYKAKVENFVAAVANVEARVVEALELLEQRRLEEEERCMAAAALEVSGAQQMLAKLPSHTRRSFLIEAARPNLAP